MNSTDLQTLMTDLGKRARAAARSLALAPSADKDKALRAAAQAIRIDTGLIL